MLGDEADRSALKDTTKKTTWSRIQKGIECRAMNSFCSVAKFLSKVVKWSDLYFRKTSLTA